MVFEEDEGLFAPVAFEDFVAGSLTTFADLATGLLVWDVELGVLSFGAGGAVDVAPLAGAEVFAGGMVRMFWSPGVGVVVHCQLPSMSDHEIPGKAAL